MRRVLVAALTLVVVLFMLAMQVTTAPAAYAASVGVSPGAGDAGSSATVAGTAFVPLVTVSLCWDGQECSDLGSVTPDVGGDFSVVVTIPSAAAAGPHSISACQAVTGCVSAGFEVLSLPDDSSTVPSTTTTVGPTTTSSQQTTTTTTRSPTTTRGSTTTLPGATTTVTSPAPGGPPQTTATTEVIAAPAQVTTTTTTTTTGGGVTSSTGIAPEEPLVEAAAAPFALDIDGLIGQLFAPDPPSDGAEVGGGGPTAAGAPLAAGAPGDVAVEEDDGDGGSRLALEEAGTGFQLPKLGIWVVWLLVVLSSTAVVLGADEWRRRRSR